jgi:elongation factor G
MEDEDAIVTANVPLAEVLEYEPKLSGLTQGKGTFSQAFDHYELVPAMNQEKIIAQSGYKHKEEEE